MNFKYSVTLRSRSRSPKRSTNRSRSRSRERGGSNNTRTDLDSAGMEKLLRERARAGAVAIGKDYAQRPVSLKTSLSVKAPVGTIRTRSMYGKCVWFRMMFVLNNTMCLWMVICFSDHLRNHVVQVPVIGLVNPVHLVLNRFVVCQIFGL